MLPQRKASQEQYRYTSRLRMFPAVFSSGCIHNGVQRRLRQLVSTGALGLLAAGAHAQGAAPVSSPDNIWLLGPGATLPLTSRLQLQANGFGVTGDVHGGATLVSLRVRPSRYVAIAPGYFGLFQPRRADGVRPYDSRARLDVTLTLPLRGFYVSDRSLVERRFQEASVATRYRNMLRVEDTVRLGRVRFTVYAADEVFYDGGVRRWTLNLAYLGLTYPFGRCTGEIFYSRQLSRRVSGLNLFLVAFSVRLRQAKVAAGRPAE